MLRIVERNDIKELQTRSYRMARMIGKLGGGMGRRSPLRFGAKKYNKGSKKNWFSRIIVVVFKEMNRLAE